MANKGFKNAPQIDYWADGMEFTWADWKWRVVHVSPDGAAACVRVSREPESDESSCLVWGIQRFNQYEDRTDTTLDLSSIWVGREYRNEIGQHSRVVCVSDTHIGILFLGHTQQLWTRGNFVASSWKPLPLEPPATLESPVQGDVDPDPRTHQQTQPEPTWVPEVGTECECTEPPDLMKQKPFPVIPRCVGKIWSWVGHSDHGVGDENVNGLIVTTKSLRPLPPEPPVKVGDEIRVTRKHGPPDYGKVSGVWPDKLEYAIQRGDEPERRYFWTAGGITHLRPVEQP